MSAKDVFLKLAPSGLEQWLRGSVYRRNCNLRPERYRSELERWYKLSKGVDCHLDDPKTLGEKIQWLKLYDSTPEKGRLADKYLVREWVADKIGEEHLIPLIGVWDRAEDIDYDALPDKFAMKATHGSGWNVIVEDKGTLDIAETNKKLSKWLSTRESMTGGFELHYDYCVPRIIVEQYMTDDSGALRDYKFITINGEVQFVLAIENRYSDESSYTYYPDWSEAPFRYGYKVGREQQVKRPENLDEMIGYAELLAQDFPFVRVDFYEIDGKVYFGEVTFTPANGLSSFTPPSYDLEYGNKLVLPEKKEFKGAWL